jgi:hypothetical protein
MRMEILFIEHHGAYPRFKFTQAFQVVSLEDPYHPLDIGFASSYAKAYEMAEEYNEERDTMMYGGAGIRIYEILIRE